MLGAIATRGGWVTGRAKEQPGVLRVQVERLLLSGDIDTAEVAPSGYRSGNLGDVSVVATEESFFFGRIRCGNASVNVPVCCAGP